MNFFFGGGGLSVGWNTSTNHWVSPVDLQQVFLIGLWDHQSSGHGHGSPADVPAALLRSRSLSGGPNAERNRPAAAGGSNSDAAAAELPQPAHVCGLGPAAGPEGPLLPGQRPRTGCVTPAGQRAAAAGVAPRQRPAQRVGGRREDFLWAQQDAAAGGEERSGLRGTGSSPEAGNLQSQQIYRTSPLLRTRSAHVWNKANRESERYKNQPGQELLYKICI